MPKPTQQQAKRKAGRPATGSTRTKKSITIPTTLLELAKKSADAKNESLSQFVSRAIQNLTMQP